MSGGPGFRGASILLVREARERLWTLPGGWAEIGRTPAEAVADEFREEAGWNVTVNKLAALLDRTRHGHPEHRYHVYKAFFLCDLIEEVPSGGSASATETDAANFFDVERLPPLELGRVTAAQIERLYEHYLDPALPADFD